MCTPGRPTARVRVSPVGDGGPPKSRAGARQAECRWIDGEGHEWVFTREGPTLLVERPSRRDSVLIRFPDLSSVGTDGSLGESWVLLCTADGRMVHCTVCRDLDAVDLMDSGRRIGSGRDMNAQVRTFLDREPLAGAATRYETATSDTGGRP